MALSKRAMSRTRKIYLYGSGSFTVFIAFLFTLANYGVTPEINSTQIIQCAGNQQELCEGYFNISLAEWHLCAGKGFEVYLNDTDGVNYTVFKADRRFRPDNPERWKPYDLDKDGTCLKNATKHEFKIIVNKPIDKTVKWGLKMGLINDVDPIFVGYKFSDFLTLKEDIADMGWARATVEVRNPTSFSFSLDKSLIEYNLTVVKGGSITNTSLSEIYYVNTSINQTESKTVCAEETTTQPNGTVTAKNVCEVIPISWKWINGTDRKSREVTAITLKPNQTKEYQLGATYPVSNNQKIYWTFGVKVSGTKFIYDPTFDAAWTRVKGIQFAFSGVQTDIPILINVTSDADMQTDCDDIRFVNASNNTVLPYALNSKVDSAWCSYWVRANGTADNVSHIYMNYGNPAATYIGDNFTTFQLYEDCNGAGVNTTTWNSSTGVGGSITIRDGHCIYDRGVMSSLKEFGQNYTIEANATLGGTANGAGLGFRAGPSANAVGPLCAGDTTTHTLCAGVHSNSAGGDQMQGATFVTTATFTNFASPADNVGFNFYIMRNSTTPSVNISRWSTVGGNNVDFDDTALNGRIETTVPTGVGYIHVGGHLSDVNINFTMNWIRVRKIDPLKEGNYGLRFTAEEATNTAPTIGEFRRDSAGAITYRFNNNGVTVYFAANDVDGTSNLNQVTIQHNNTVNSGLINVTNSSLTMTVINSSAWNASYTITDVFGTAINVTAFVNDSTNAQASSGTQTIAIARAVAASNTTVYLNHSIANATASYPGIFNSSVVFNASGCNGCSFSVYRNDTLTSNDTNLAIGAGIFTFRGGLQSDSGNYSAGNYSNVQATVTATPIEMAIFQDGYATPQKFEYQRRNINITIQLNSSTAFCVDFDAVGFENTTCFPTGLTGTLNLTTLKEFRAYNFSDGTRTKIITFPIMEYCRQESSNTTNQTGADGDCRLQYNGVYVFSKNSSTDFTTAWQPGEDFYDGEGALIDGDYGTLSSQFPPYNTTYISILDINYTKPQNITFSALWQRRWLDSPGIGISNISIIRSCLDSDILRLRILLNRTSATEGQTWYQCYTNSVWSTITIVNSLSIYEESLYWRIEKGAIITLNLTRYRNITSAGLNLTGNTNAYDICWDIGADGFCDAIFPGFINASSYLVQNTFTNNLTSQLILFPASGSTTRYLNYSTSALNFSNINLTDHLYQNISLQLWGTDANSVAINFIENFTSDRYINRTGSNSSFAGRYGSWVYEDFTERPINVTKRWTRYDILTPPDTSWTFDSTNNFTRLESTHRGGEGQVGQKLRVRDLDFRDYYDISTNITGSLTGHPNAAGTITIGLRNNNTGAGSALVTFSVSNGGVFNDNIRLNRTDSTVRGYRNGILSNSITLDTSANYTLYYDQSVTASGSGGGQTIPFRLDIQYINISGVAGNYTRGQSYDNATIRSTQVVNSSTVDFSIAQLDADYITPSGSNITWYLSADNASTWEEVVLGQTHLFTNVGKGISWRADFRVNESGNISNFFPTTPIIKRVTLSGPTGNTSNVTIDIGADGTYEWRGRDEGLTQLNSSVSPRNITLSNASVASYIFNNCKTTKTCLIPVRFSSDSAGILNYTRLNASTSTTNLKPLFFNATRIDSLLINSSQVNVTIRSPRGGSLEVTNFSYSYPDDWNYTIRVRLNDTANFTSSINTTALIARYSRFLEKIIDPLGWAIFPKSTNDTNVPAERQNSTHGVYNITGNATLDNFTVFFRQDEAVNTCLNVTFSNTSSVPNGLNMSLNFQHVLHNITRNQGWGVWTFGNFSGCSPLVYLPNISFSAVCRDCIRGAGSP